MVASDDSMCLTDFKMDPSLPLRVLQVIISLPGHLGGCDHCLHVSDFLPRDGRRTNSPHCSCIKSKSIRASDAAALQKNASDLLCATLSILPKVTWVDTCSTLATFDYLKVALRPRLYVEHPQEKSVTPNCDYIHPIYSASAKFNCTESHSEIK